MSGKLDRSEKSPRERSEQVSACGSREREGASEASGGGVPASIKQKLRARATARARQARVRPPISTPARAKRASESYARGPRPERVRRGVRGPDTARAKRAGESYARGPRPERVWRGCGPQYRHLRERSEQVKVTREGHGPSASGAGVGPRAIKNDPSTGQPAR